MRTLDNTMVRINDVKLILRHRTYTTNRFRLIDTTPGRASGQKFDLVEQEKRRAEYRNDRGEIVVNEWEWQNVRKIASTHDTSIPTVKNKGGNIGAYGPTFNRRDIGDIYEGLQ
jgi:hypothetical protein